MKFSNRLYDILKWIAQYFLPGLGSFYFGLSKIWGVPYGEEVVGTLSLLAVFMGVILGISKLSYAGEGTLQIDTTRSKDIYRLDLNTPVQDLTTMKQVIFKVEPDARLDAASQG